MRPLARAGGEEEPRGAGWRCSSHTHMEELPGGYPTSSQILSTQKCAPLSAAVPSLAAVPSARAVSALEPGQHLRVEAVPSSNLLDLRQKSY